MAEPLFNRAEFEPAGPQEPAASANETAAVRLRRPVRDQVEFGCAALDQLIDPDHPVRLVWELVCRFDLLSWLCDVQAVAGRPGRDTTDPRLLLSLWVYATLQGVGSARALARLCEQHLAYRWLCGGGGDGQSSVVVRIPLGCTRRSKTNNDCWKRVSTRTCRRKTTARRPGARGWARRLYRLRAQTAEWINAVCRNRGLTRLLVRGLAKCSSVALLQIITHNLFQGETLRACRLAG